MIVDTGLHYVGLSRNQALGYFSKYAWDDTDLARKEVVKKLIASFLPRHFLLVLPFFLS